MTEKIMVQTVQMGSDQVYGVCLNENPKIRKTKVPLYKF